MKGFYAVFYASLVRAHHLRVPIAHGGVPPSESSPGLGETWGSRSGVYTSSSVSK